METTRFVYTPPRADTFSEWLAKQHVSIYVDPKEKEIERLATEILNMMPFPYWIVKAATKVILSVRRKTKYPITKKSVLAAIYVISRYEYPYLAEKIEKMPCIDTEIPCYASKKLADPEFKRYYMTVQEYVAEERGPPPRGGDFITYVIKKYSIPVPTSVAEKAKEIYEKLVEMGEASGHKTTTLAAAVLVTAIEMTLPSQELKNIVISYTGVSKNTVKRLSRKIKNLVFSR